MGLNSVSNNIQSTYYTNTKSKKANEKENTNPKDKPVEKKEDAVAYTPSNEPKTDSTKKTYARDTDTINRLIKDADDRKQQLRDLVDRTLGKQAGTFQISKSSITDLISSGKLTSKDIEQAQADISEDGYWGVNQTSERLFSFAYALAGGDPSKADTLMAAIEKGFKQATKSWGDKLPDICQKTFDSVKEKMDNWKNEVKETKETAE